MPENTPSEPTDDVVLPENNKVLTTVVFALGSTSVALVGAFAASVLKKTAVLTYLNLGHAVETKGKVWLSSRFRDFSK